MTNNGKRPRRRYDDKFRASAVVMLEAAGYPDKEGALMTVARHLGMPHNTLRNWYHAERNPPPSELRQDIKKSLSEMLEDIAYKLIEAMPGKVLDASLQQTATSMAIAIDKMQLLSGKPTDIVENRGNPLDKLRSRLNSIVTAEGQRNGTNGTNGHGSGEAPI